MRFRLFRSRAFWFGVPGLVFLLWAWWISMSYHTAGRFDGRYFAYAGQCGGIIGIEVRPGPGMSSGWEGWHERYPPQGMRELRKQVRNYADREDTAIVLPHWLALAIYSTGWAGLVGWRWREHLGLETCRRAVSRTNSL